MDEMLSDGYGGPGCGGMGCGVVFWMVGALLLLVLVAGMGGDARSTTDSSTHELMSHNLSENKLLSENQVELMSRNQVNILSNPQNCWGDGSCPQFNITTTNEIRASGNGSPVMFSPSGVPVCLDPATGYWTDLACKTNGGQP